MTTLPLIGLTGRRTHGHRQEGYVQELHHLDLDLYFVDYARAVTEAGGLPVFLPLEVDPGLAVKRLDGILLTGGADVDPIRYDADRHPEVTEVERERDAFEFALLGEALHHHLPVLGICRGVQVINVHLGGTLHQHVPSHTRYDVGSAGLAHAVRFDAGSILGSLYGASVEVNSLHHQAIDRLGDGLTVTARSDDGAIEGVERGDDLVGVQWHPEMMDTRPDDPIFGWIVEGARSRASAR